MRRALIALVAVVVIGVGIWAIAASGGDDDNGDSATAGSSKPSGSVRFWVMNNGPDPVADTEEIVAPFEKKTGIDVEVQLVGWDVQLDRIRNAAVSGKGPDVTQAGTTQVPFFAALGGFEDLSGRVGDIGGESAYAPGVWQTTQVTGRDGDYAVPWFTEARSIYYRKDLLKKAGIDPATAFTDWDALHATLKKLKDSGAVDNKKTYAFGSPGKQAFDLVHHVMPFVWDAGGAELNEDASESTIDTPGGSGGRGVRRRPGTRGLVRPDRPREGRAAGGGLVQGRPAGRLDRRSVGAGHDPAQGRRRVGAGGAQERRRRPDAGRSLGQGLHVRGRLEPDDVQDLGEQGRGLGADEVPVPGRRPRRPTRT